MGNFKESIRQQGLLILAFQEHEKNPVFVSPPIRDILTKGSLTMLLAECRLFYPGITRLMWERLGSPTLQEIVTSKDRRLAYSICNGVSLLKQKLIERRNLAGLPVFRRDMKNLVYGRDSEDYEEWGLLNELEDGLLKVFRQDQPQQTAAPVKTLKRRPNFEDYCFEQMKQMEEGELRAFLYDTQQGDGLTFDRGKSWMDSFNLILAEAGYKKIKTFSSSVSRAKSRIRIDF
jgi:hypothetical protein